MTLCSKELVLGLTEVSSKHNIKIKPHKSVYVFSMTSYYLETPG